MPDFFDNSVRSMRQRTRPRVTQEDLARRVGISQAGISQIEWGRPPTFQHALELAAALGSTVEEVFYAQARAAREAVRARTAVAHDAL